MMLRMAQALVFVALVSGARANADPVQTNPSSQPAARQVTPATLPAANSIPAGVVAQAIQRAADAKKYLFIFFYKAEDDATKSARKTFEEATSKLAEKAEAVVVNAGDRAELGVVNRFGLRQAPMPLVLAIGPTGAVTQNFTQNFDEQQLRTAFVSPGTEKSLKALQDRKYVLLCVQNGETQFNDQAMQGVRDFAADPRYARSVEIVTVDPSDAREVDFLVRFGLNVSGKEAVTLLLAPPGKVMGTFIGATDKNTLLATATPPKAGGCCGGGSGSSTCGTKK